MTDIEYLLFLVDEMSEEWYKEIPKTPIRKAQFDMMSYSRWTMDEIKFYIYSHTDQSPIEIIENFLDQVSAFAARAKTIEANTAFSTACDVAIAILDELHCMN